MTWPDGYAAATGARCLSSAIALHLGKGRALDSVPQGDFRDGHCTPPHLTIRTRLINVARLMSWDIITAHRAQSIQLAYRSLNGDK
jgi:hypothetical protein